MLGCREHFLREIYQHLPGIGCCLVQLGSGVFLVPSSITKFSTLPLEDPGMGRLPASNFQGRRNPTTSSLLFENGWLEDEIS